MDEALGNIVRQIILDSQRLNDKLEAALGEHSDALATQEAMIARYLDDVTPPPPPTDFAAFHTFKHFNQPNLAALGMPPLKIFYSGAFFDERDNRDPQNPVSFQDVNPSKVTSTAQSAPLQSYPDIERWAHKHTWRVPPENIKRYIEFCKLYRRNLTTNKHVFGMYSIMPVRNYWDAIAPTTSLDYKKWQKWNDEVAPICEHVDVLFPSLYTFHDKSDPNKYTRDGWVKYAKANIEEAYRIGGNKPVFGMLWPRFHPGNAGEIPGDYWELQLDTVRAHADGLVIWDDRKSDRTDFNSLGDWWDVTEAKLREWDLAP